MAALNTPQQQTATNPGLINGVAQAGVREIDGTMRTVAANETVQGQLHGILANESPLMQQARAKAMEGMQERGLVNSAMAQTAGQSAVIDKSLQIATPDAAAHLQASRDNQIVANETSRFNADAWNKGQQFNSGETNKFGLQTLADKGAWDRSKLAADTQITTTGMNNATSITTTGMNNASQIEATRMNNNTALAQTKMSTEASILTTSMNNEVSRYAANLSADTQRSIASTQIAATNALHVMDNEHRATLQNSQGAQQIYRDGTADIQAIMINPDLDGPTRQRLVENRIGMINGGLDLTASTMRVDVPDFAAYPLPAPTAAPAPAPAPAGSNNPAFDFGGAP